MSPTEGAEMDTTVEDASRRALDSLRAKLEHLVTSACARSSSPHTPASALLNAPTKANARADPLTASSAAVVASAAPASVDTSSSFSSFLSSFDALKLVVFRQDKLGLSLVKVSALSHFYTCH